MSERTKLDELLNAFVDGEVSDRQATEVKRLMLHDPAIAARVERLQKQRKLMAALPAENAPADMAATVRSMLERRTLLETSSSGRHHVLGSMHLFSRKAAAIAAMLALLGGLGYLVYSVVGPGMDNRVPAILATGQKSGTSVTAAGGRKAVAAATSIELLLKTASFRGLDSVVQKAIDSCGLWDLATVDRQPASVAYSLTCDRESMARVLNQMAGAWDKVEQKSLTIASAGEDAVTVKAVTFAQVAAVIASPDLPSRMASARQFAEANTREPTDNDAVAEQDKLSIPKPSLTSPEFDKAAAASVDSKSDKVNLTIKVTTEE